MSTHLTLPDVGLSCSPCPPLPILSLSGVDRRDCLYPCLSVLCELWVELVLSQIAPHSLNPPQSGPSSRSLPSTFIVATCFATFVYVLLITWPYHERCFCATYVEIGLTIASLLNFSFLIRSFLRNTSCQG